MGKFDFDEVIDRHGTGSIKVDCLKERFGRDDLCPLWVADMDFVSPPAITKAIIERTKHGVFGYTNPSQSYFDSIINWVDRRHNWTVDQEWLTFIPGIVKGISFVIDCFTKSGEKIVIQPPVYPPFRNIPELRKMQVVTNPLILDDGKYLMDLEGLRKVIDKDCKILILCNPHNPGGRVWSREELQAIAEICYDNNILVISDEIHSDLAYNENKHIPFASVSAKAAMNSITFMAPSKTFNIAGIVSSFSIIPNAELRTKFLSYLECAELSSTHIFAYTATEAAYNEGEEWLEEAKSYLWDNVLFIDNFLKNNIPQLKAMIPEASFLIWLDCRKLELSQSELNDLFINKANLALNDGATFGEEGVGYMRLNVGTQRFVLEKALDDLKRAVQEK